jgi:two-component system, NarL family, nitrate/nitrite response regulator NarL
LRTSENRRAQLIHSILRSCIARRAILECTVTYQLGRLDGTKKPGQGSRLSRNRHEHQQARLAPAGVMGKPHRIRFIPDKDNKVRVVVADDHPVFREGVVRALQASSAVEVVAEVDDGRRALEEAAALHPDVALLDYKLPEMDGIAVIKAITRDHLSTRALLLSAHNESGIVYDALQAGAAGYLSKEASREQILDAVLAVARGESVLPSDVAAGLVGEIRMRAPTTGPALTDRESEILRLIADGKSFPEIARELYLGVTTVKTHVQHVYEKLGVSDRAAAVAEAFRKHLIE